MLNTSKIWYIIHIFPWLILSLFLWANHRDVYREAEVLSEVREKILTSYVDPVTSDKLLKNALQGMLSGLDEYSEYLDEENLRQVLENTQGEFIGIGVVVSVESGMITVIAPVEDSPAAKAGILAGDKILSIDDQSTELMNLNEAIRRMRGDEGTPVRLKVIHEGSHIPIDIPITRGIIHIHSIKDQKMLTHSIGYLRLTKFNKNTAGELQQAIESLRLQGMKSLIIDLRFNPGGLMESAVEVLNLFVSDGILVYTKGRTPDSFQVFRAVANNTYKDLGLAILINKHSASASEIVAGSLQDHKRAFIVGERSYGKGLVQTIMILRDEHSAVKITTARYYTPSGRSIQRTQDNLGGVVPDTIVSISKEQEQKLMEQFYQGIKDSTADDIQLKQAMYLFPRSQQ